MNSWKAAKIALAGCLGAFTAGWIIGYSIEHDETKWQAKLADRYQKQRDEYITRYNEQVRVNGEQRWALLERKS